MCPRVPDRHSGFTDRSSKAETDTLVLERFLTLRYHKPHLNLTHKTVQIYTLFPEANFLSHIEKIGLVCLSNLQMTCCGVFVQKNVLVQKLILRLDDIFSGLCSEGVGRTIQSMFHRSGCQDTGWL